MRKLLSTILVVTPLYGACRTRICVNTRNRAVFDIEIVGRSGNNQIDDKILATYN